jgi:hypothetical protein
MSDIMSKSKKQQKKEMPVKKTFSFLSGTPIDLARYEMIRYNDNIKSNIILKKEEKKQQKQQKQYKKQQKQKNNKNKKSYNKDYLYEVEIHNYTKQQAAEIERIKTGRLIGFENLDIFISNE